jgi:hypothetical protein
MYNEELESLIDIALADGELSEKERKVLYKKAQSLGIDIDEFEMVLDARLAKRQKHLNTGVKRGSVRTCPECGEVVSGLVPVCPHCGYIFTDVEAVNSSVRLSESIADIMNSKDYDDDKIKKIVSCISNFPIPTTAEDLLEFITTMGSHLKAEKNQNLYQAYKTKYLEAVSKAQILFPNNPTFDFAINSTQTSSENFFSRIWKSFFK